MISTTDFTDGFVDGQQAPQPVPDRSIPTPAATYRIDSVNGDDSKGIPYKTYKAALAAATKFQVANPNALVELSLACGNPPCMENTGMKNPNNLLFSSYNQGSTEDMAWIGGTAPFVFIAGGQNVYIKGLRIKANDPNQVSPSNDYGINFNGQTNCQVLYCDVDGYGLNCSYTGTGKVSEFVFEHNFCARSWKPGQPLPANGRDWRSQGIYTQNTTLPSIQGNVFYKNGYNLSEIHMVDTQTYAQFQFSHGWYGNESGSGPNVDNQNIYWLNACSGPMLRMGGISSWNVFAYNGNAADVYGGGSAFQLSDSVVLGFPTSYTPRTFPGWGGGIEISAQAASVKRILFLGANTSYGTNFPPQPVLLHNSPAPGATALVDGVYGIWPNWKQIIQNKGYLLTTGTNSVRAPKPTDVLPDLLSFTGTNSEDAAAEILRLNKHNIRFGAVAAVSYFRRAAAVIL